ncbi:MULTISPECIES: phosphoglycerate dehydrogenase [unclassified Brevundimonas]|uniref:phosphoglycerate dehydrogenase n=1 Tax=unclassified Brevundimonas TaxID=2622653 RepID=UPI000CFBFFC1|nr:MULTISPECIES: phosphoglycerate dehydrogenase [unclassified Brevundimonas]PRA26495.1 phosphoglycerate dehydrogenase [Brevundimonas sp. MYb27]PQZ83210.1 phosphoglycerate dehydrogenase [Brevundimonas sp. MYb31]PRB16256.1 phosphoglycerate dehydrogenase [Brevundimonas sp. MYb52]PRB35132.1 phosphoglycerate dehydrogenase [Brevundimonas sp. MYb46]PRB49817.1 phosphoglycerate dehydrogenase [Brevundimonas sp. MYb33]
MTSPVFIFDFDSTLVRIETLEALADIALSDAPDAAAKKAEIAALTDQAMSGEVDFGTALRRRLALLGLNRGHVEALADRVLDEASASIRRNVDFFERHAERVYILSGGFREVIAPLAARLGIAAEHVLCNDLIYDAEGRVTGVDDANPLSRDNGKPEVIKALNLTGPVVMVGDGWTDAEVKLAGAADRFYAFTEVVSRSKVVAVADATAASLDEVLFAEGVSGRWSYPRNRVRMLLLENIHPAAVERLEEAGYSVETMKGALDEDDLIEAIKGVHVLGIRSKTNVSARVLEQADRLLAVAAFCIGTNQIDLEAAAEHGVAVFNAPYSNTRSVVELAIGLTIVLMRDVADKSAAMHQGQWNKSATGSRELRGKTLGIVGYGAIGSQLSVLAEGLGMRVIFHDLSERLALGNARRMRSLDALLAEADVVSLHVDGRKDNADVIGAAQFAKMKPGALFLNLSRGHVVDVDALAEAVKSGRIAGAAVDVFPEEPRTNADPFASPLQGLKNVILSPHIGGSTEEAQEAIAEFAAERLLGYLNRGDTTFCVNLPNVQLAEVSRAHRLLHIHRNQPGVLAELNRALSSAGLNILGQHLKTDERTGYVITDVDRDYDPEVLKVLRDLPGTVRFRMLH